MLKLPPSIISMLHCYFPILIIHTQKSKGKSIFSPFRQKVKISFSKTRLTDIINELRLYNEDLGRLSSQIRKLASNSVKPSQTVTSTVTSHLQITQQASIRLYDVLASGWACDDRVEHVASMSLKVEEKCQHSASKVRFNLAVTCVQPSLRCKPLWLAIESAPSDAHQEQPLQEPSATLQNTLQKMGATGRVRFALSASVVATSTTKNSPSKPQPSAGPQLDLCTIGRLCRYFRQLQSQVGSEPCIGFLEQTKTFKHFVYRNPSPHHPVDDLKSISLKQILHSAAEKKREDDWIEKLRLARLLALAVLRFHHTPWLPDSWSSSDVRFIGKDAFSEQDKLPHSPCLNAQLSSTAPNNRQITHSSSNASSLATNEMLFSLGVVLIELGHDAPFESLSQGGGLQIGTNKQVADFIAARRLGESVHRKLNRTYGRLVEKCLNCNFGVATKLDDTELQGAVVVHVVNQLDLCLDQYRAFNSLAPLPVCI